MFYRFARLIKFVLGGRRQNVTVISIHVMRFQPTLRLNVNGGNVCTPIAVVRNRRIVSTIVEYLKSILDDFPSIEAEDSDSVVVRYVDGSKRVLIRNN